MKIENLFHIILFSLLFLSACNREASKVSLADELTISLSDDSNSIELHKIRPEVLEYFKSDSLTEKDWKGFLSVYPDTDDPELRDLQKPLDGNYLVRDSVIFFVPKEEFQKDSSYFVRVYSKDIVSGPADFILGGKLPQRSEPIEFFFKR